MMVEQVGQDLHFQVSGEVQIWELFLGWTVGNCGYGPEGNWGCCVCKATLAACRITWKTTDPEGKQGPRESLLPSRRDSTEKKSPQRVMPIDSVSSNRRRRGTRIGSKPSNLHNQR